MNYHLINKYKAQFYASRKIILAVLILFFQIISPAISQDSTKLKSTVDSATVNYDSATNRLFKSIKNFRDEQHKQNLIEYNEDIIATKQDEILEEIRRLSLEAESQLQTGVDTGKLNTQLKKVEDWYRVTSDGIFINPGTLHTHRNLRTSYRILDDLLQRTLERKVELDSYYKRLIGLRNTIDSLYKDSALYKLSSDSAVLMRYVKNLIVVYDEIKPIDSSFKITLLYLSDFQTKVNRIVNRLNGSLEKIEGFQRELSYKSFSRETTNLGDPARYVRPFGEIIDFSLIKALLALRFYAVNEIGNIGTMLVLVFIVTVLLQKLKFKLSSQKQHNWEVTEQPVLKYPVLSAIFIVFNLYQFAFPDPPFVFNALIWVISSIAATIIFKNFITRYWMIAWLAVFTIFLLTCVENMILQASRPERWFMLALSISGILAFSAILLIGRRNELKDKLLVYFIGLVILLQILSVIANMFGRYNLSKTLLTSGYLNLVIAILFLWTVRLVNDAFRLANQAYQTQGKKLFNINFDKVGTKAPRIFYVLLVLGWFVLFSRNFYVSKLLFDPIGNFISRTRKIGEFSFSIQTLLEFFLILYLAALASRIVSFFATDNQAAPAKRKSGIGSWLLLIRISIFTIGLLLAFAAVGIPMDRLTIIISALGVGVGFGLQSLVNSLVSGLIISFEKPISVGDTVEIDGKSGVVKSIGFRSSIISTGAGSEIIIPNGDLLNRHLVNWTHDNTSRRVDIILGVAYGTDLKKLIGLLKDLPAKDQRILSYPQPTIVIKDFRTTAIDIQLSFWVGNMAELAFVKSDINLAIDAALKENNIQVTTPPIGPGLPVS